MDPSSKSFAEIARKLLDQNRVAADQMQTRLVQAQDPDYWRSLNPQLHIEGSLRPDFEPLPASDADISKCLDSVRRFGYFKLPPVIAPHVLQEMVAAVETLAAEDWPATFAMVYDEFWQISRTSTAKRLLESILGPGFKQNSNTWTHHVRPARGSSGWHPHIDGLQDSTDRLSLWIPLTDATLDNGCMYVIPRDRMPAAL
ncbi:MAG TPA: phytanoyl-CoA dioxygenase family protein, partial [Terriglobales bacterium]|nr:phytanoyl-CoA dioxygenase family protein [Terriglobales bacterium]